MSDRPPPTDPGRMLRAFGAIAARVGHLDNTGAPCRIEFDTFHDACAICCLYVKLLDHMRDHGLDADELIEHMPDLTLADMRATERKPS